MKHLIPLLVLLAGCDGGGPASLSIGSYEAAADAAAKQIQQMASILGGVKDKATAEAAKPKLEAVEKALGQIVAAVEKLGPAGDVSKSSPTMRKALEALSESTEAYLMRAIDSPEIGAVLAETQGAISGHLMQLRGMLGD